MLSSGIIVIFMYVGGEVAIGSAITNFLGQPDVAGLTELQASQIRLALLGRAVDWAFYGRG